MGEGITLGKWIIPWVVAIAMFMETLDSTIVSVAIPTIARDFHMNPIDLKLALTAYLFSLSIFIPISGWIADRFRADRVFQIALALFSLSSLACALSPNLKTLVIARCVQGLGGALMMPVGRLILMRVFDQVEMIRAVGIMVVPGLVGPAMGPLLGGIILHFTSWHWIFLVNLPFGLLGLLATYWLLPKEWEGAEVQPFDWKGFILFSLGLSLLTVAMAILGDKFSLWHLASSLAFCAILAFSIFFYCYKKQPYPILRLDLFKKPTFRVSMAVNFFVRLSTGALPFLLPLVIQLVWQGSALESSYLFLALSGGMIASRTLISQTLLLQWGYRLFLLRSVSLLSVLSMLLTIFIGFPNILPLLALLFLVGMLTTQVYMGFGSLYRIELESSEFSQSTSIASTIQQFSAGFGIALAAIILHGLSKGLGWVLFSPTVFILTLLILNALGLFSLFFIRQLNPELGLASPRL